jgi:tricarballylate dehydrogenase
VTKVQADTLEELATKLDDVNPQGFLDIREGLQRRGAQDMPFNPNVKDGRAPRAACKVVKSNWANTLDEPPVRGLSR